MCDMQINGVGTCWGHLVSMQGLLQLRYQVRSSIASSSVLESGMSRTGTVNRMLITSTSSHGIDSINKVNLIIIIIIIIIVTQKLNLSALPCLALPTSKTGKECQEPRFDSIHDNIPYLPSRRLVGVLSI